MPSFTWFDHGLSHNLFFVSSSLTGKRSNSILSLEPSMNVIILLFLIVPLFSRGFEVNFKSIPPARGLGCALITRRRKLTRSTKMSLTEMDMDGWTPPTPMDSYTFVPPEVGLEIYVGSIIALVPIVWATIEFTSRIRVQQECLVCKGAGLVSITKSGSQLARPRKCWNCGGFLPWLGWKYFFSLAEPGNGGVLLRPSKDYDAVQERMRAVSSNVLDTLRDDDEDE